MTRVAACRENVLVAIDDQRFTGKLADFGMTYEEPSASSEVVVTAATNGSHGSANKSHSFLHKF